MSPITWPHFAAAELRCKCGKCNSTGAEMDPAFMEELVILRQQFGRPMTLSSAYRCPKHAVEVSKPAPGEHCTGLAVDVRCRGEDAVEILRLAMNLKFTRFGISQRGNSRFLHLGMTPAGGRFPSPAIWSY